MEQYVKQWLDFAEQDACVAEHLLTSFYPKPIEIICYHAQQCAEKAIKAVILSNGAPGGLPKSHDLSLLLNQICHAVIIPEELYDCADLLSPYSVSARYPNELDLAPRDAEKAVESAKKILSWAKAILEA